MKASKQSAISSRRVGEILIDEAFLLPLLNEIRRIVESTVASEAAKLFKMLEAREAVRKVEPSQPSSIAVTAGVQVSPADKLKAADLRTALILGKLPDDPGLLIDTKTTAKLLNISPRLLFSLYQSQAMPEPVRLGRLVQWRLAEIIEWIDSGCPPIRRWTYSGQSGTVSRKPRKE